jgi:mRNA-degrading endonuclease RelE of RelBE toxin-antitoxin system
MQIYFSDIFKKQLKTLKKRYVSVKDDLLLSLDNLKLKDERFIGRGIYKIRVRCSDSLSGKKGGFRVYLYYYKKRELLVALCIYHKSKKESISQIELKYYFDEIVFELTENYTKKSL